VLPVATVTDSSASVACSYCNWQQCKCCL